ncbi:DUF4868 domain-containing protein [Clostridium thermarum]|uniref:DUF4868 domain-containing protein n=1 Tax=Clostridium thermarum TaxID=1716543 RepID=UPI001121DF76|nr:DUF4868 domain-containing protein [Clostridium thermarum]
MSYEKIKEGLEKINSITSWSLALINYNHKSRPGEYTCYSLKFQTDELLKKTISEMCTSFISIVNKNGNNIQYYTGTNPKDIVDKILISDTLISHQWNNLIASLNVCDDSVDLKDIKSQAYIFAGTYTIEGEYHNIYILSRKNPIYTYKKGKGKIFESRHNIIQEITEPLVQFGKTFDALIYDKTMYSINNNFESIFNMEYSHKIVCKSSLEVIENASIIDDFEAYKTFALSGQHPRKFITFDKRIIENIKEESNLNILTQELKIPYDITRGKFNLSDEKHAEVFTKAICGKTKYNMFTGGVCEVPNSIPLNIS